MLRLIAVLCLYRASVEALRDLHGLPVPKQLVPEQQVCSSALCYRRPAYTH